MGWRHWMLLCLSYLLQSKKLSLPPNRLEACRPKSAGAEVGLSSFWSWLWEITDDSAGLSPKHVGPLIRIWTEIHDFVVERTCNNDFAWFFACGMNEKGPKSSNQWCSSGQVSSFSSSLVVPLGHPASSPSKPLAGARLGLEHLGKTLFHPVYPVVNHHVPRK